ncbi:hypothetical protein VTO42DRAFT_4010 [Malbranchea cinnamomea]
MLLEAALSQGLQQWPGMLILLLSIYLASNYYHKGLNKYPGPFLGALTNWWRFFDVLSRRPDITHRKLHQKHGDIVRLGPNVLSFANPNAVKTIYGLNKGFIKSKFYPVQMAVAKGKPVPSLFNTQDETFHANLRRCVNSAFSMSALVQYEPMIDKTTELFLDQTSKIYASTGKVCDFSKWLQFYAFDVIGSITYSKRHGFIERNEDVDGITAWIQGLFSYAGPVGQMPWLDKLLRKNPILALLDRCGLIDNTFAVAKFAKARMAERLAEMESNSNEGKDAHHGRGDLLSMFLKAQELRPDFMNDTRVLGMATSMAFAGSDTTAISLSAVFYYLLKNPQCYKKLLEELGQAVKLGTIENRPTGLVSWSESQKLPYLDACIKEALRLHPAAGLPLERIVPPQGIEICGEFIPGGTIVGCSAWILHRREEVFGDQVEEYRPERWLDAEPAKLKEMNGTMFQFGAGSRTCIGKNISLMEIYKLVPSFLRRFEVRLADPQREWKLHNAWFVKQKEFYVTFKPRECW